MSSSTGVILLTYVSHREIVTTVDQTAQQKLSFLHAVMLPCPKDLQSVQGHIISSKPERAEHTHTEETCWQRHVWYWLIDYVWAEIKTTVPYSLGTQWVWECICVCWKLLAHCFSVHCVCSPEIDAWEPISRLWTAAQFSLNYHIFPQCHLSSGFFYTQTKPEHVISCL